MIRCAAPLSRRCAAIDNPYGPAPIMTMSELLRMDYGLPVEKNSLSAPGDETLRLATNDLLAGCWIRSHRTSGLTPPAGPACVGHSPRSGKDFVHLSASRQSLFVSFLTFRTCSLRVESAQRPQSGDRASTRRRLVAKTSNPRRDVELHPARNASRKAAFWRAASWSGGASPPSTPPLQSFTHVPRHLRGVPDGGRRTSAIRAGC